MKMHDTIITPDAHSYGYTKKTDKHDKILSCSRIPRRRAEDILEICLGYSTIFFRLTEIFWRIRHTVYGTAV
jgi:hypothetical protein